MNNAAHGPIAATDYKRTACSVGIVHLGFGAFHRAHQAVCIDDYMAKSPFAVSAATYSSKIGASRATKSGYYTDTNSDLNVADPTIKAEIAGGVSTSVYGYLRGALQRRLTQPGAPLTIACCDNIRQNGKMLRRNLCAYQQACGDQTLATWVAENVAFPCSIVDRITPRSPANLEPELSGLVGSKATSPIMVEDFIQWVLQDSAKSEMPDLAQVGVTVTADVGPYEETKIRMLNGGHTALAYLAALDEVETFDAAMRTPALNAHFQSFEAQEVLPAITFALPFSKQDYLANIARCFGNKAIGDTVARICADGMAKFPIFIRPTLEGCLRQGITPVFTIRSLASWYVFASHVAAGKIPFDYVEPGWDDLQVLLGTDAFMASRHLWGDLPETHPIFAEVLRREISELEKKWPV